MANDDQEILGKTHKKALKGAPRWMVTFADLMALLFAFFVLLLSFSDVDSDSFRRNAGPMREAFNKPAGVLPVAGSGTAIERTVSIGLQPFQRQDEWRSDILDTLRSALADEIARRLIIIVERDDAVVIRFPASTAFASGSDRLRDQVLATLERIAGVLAATEGRILVSGHTDDVPIATAKFRSNWDLSTSRAVSVVHRLLADERVDAARVTARGFADSRPLAANTSPENRAANRRVEIAIEIAED